MFHFVWIPKYRHKVFVEPQRKIIKSIIHKIGYDIDIVELEIPEEHIHMVVRRVPIAVAKWNNARKKYFSKKIL